MQDFAKTRHYATLESDLDLIAEGAMGAPARHIMATTAGNLWVVEDGDGHGQSLPIPANTPDFLRGRFRSVALGAVATLTCTGGSYPAVLEGAETMVLRIDEGLPSDTGDVTVSFAAGSFTLTQIVAAINAAVSAALGYAAAVASAEDDELQVVGVARGTAGCVEIVSVGATLATATGLTVGETNGSASGAASGLIVQW